MFGFSKKTTETSTPKDKKVAYINEIGIPTDEEKKKIKEEEIQKYRIARIQKIIDDDNKQIENSKEEEVLKDRVFDLFLEKMHEKSPLNFDERYKKAMKVIEEKYSNIKDVEDIVLKKITLNEAGVIDFKIKDDIKAIKEEKKEVLRQKALAIFKNTKNKKIKNGTENK